MSATATIMDFARWLAEAFGPGPARPPGLALGVRDGAPARLRWTGAGYAVERPARPGDRGPLCLDEDQALTLRLTTSAAAAAHGAGGARIEAARRCPFPLDEAAHSLTPANEAWGAEGAAWLLAAAPRARVDAIRAELAAAGAAPGPAFAVAEGVALPLGAGRRPVLGPAVAVIALAAMVLGAGAAIVGADRMETAAESRLAAARADLARAEAMAAEAEAARDQAARPLRAAQAAGAILSAAPPAARALAALAAATPDDAYAKRLTITPGRIEAEVAAPDVAGLAARLAAAPGFSAAGLKTGARASGTEGLQGALLTITLEAGE